MSFFRFPTTISDALKDAIKDRDAVSLLEDRDRALEDYLSNSEPAPSGGILAYASYAPVGSTYSQVIPSSLSDIDAGFRLKVTFTVPASGAVIVDFDGVVRPSQWDAICNFFTVGLYNPSTMDIVTSSLVLSDTTILTNNASGHGVRTHASMIVSGLTAGEEVTYWLAGGSSMSTGNLQLRARAYDGVSGDSVPGPWSITVQALPA